MLYAFNSDGDVDFAVYVNDKQISHRILFTSVGEVSTKTFYYLSLSLIVIYVGVYAAILLHT